MRIGKTIKVVTSPKRQVRKFNHKKQEQPIPVKMPEKVSEQVAWKVYNWGWDIGRKDLTVFINACS